MCYFQGFDIRTVVTSTEVAELILELVTAWTISSLNPFHCWMGFIPPVIQRVQMSATAKPPFLCYSTPGSPVTRARLNKWKANGGPVAFKSSQRSHLAKGSLCTRGDFSLVSFGPEDYGPHVLLVLDTDWLQRKRFQNLTQLLSYHSFR